MDLSRFNLNDLAHAVDGWCF